jgi:dihydrofolate reductase
VTSTAAPAPPDRTRLPAPTHLTIIAAIAANGVIGRDNGLPWRLGADLQRFRRLTTGHAIIMGRKTFESLGRLLPERTHIVLSRSGAAPAGCLAAHTLEAALALCADADEAFVIGGGDIYRQALPLADRLQVTEIHEEFPGDTFFPEIDPGEWRESARERHRAEAGFDFDFVTYERK